MSVGADALLKRAYSSDSLGLPIRAENIYYFLNFWFLIIISLGFETYQEISIFLFLTMQGAMQLIKGMNNCKIFYINSQKCIQDGRMSIVEDNGLTPGFKVTDHSFETFCGCEIGWWDMRAIKYDWNVSSSNSCLIDNISDIICWWKYQSTIWRYPNVLTLRWWMKLNIHEYMLL